VVKPLATQLTNAQEPTKSEELFLIATDAKHAQQVKLPMILEPTATLQDQHAHATRLLMPKINAKTAHLTNSVIKDKLLATLSKHALEPTKLEVMFKTAIDAKHAQLDNLLMTLEPTAILQDQLAHATKLLIHLTNAKTAQLTNLLIVVPLNAYQLQLALNQVNILESLPTVTDVDNANLDG